MNLSLAPECLWYNKCLDLYDTDNNLTFYCLLFTIPALSFGTRWDSISVLVFYRSVARVGFGLHRDSLSRIAHRYVLFTVITFKIYFMTKLFIFQGHVINCVLLWYLLVSWKWFRHSYQTSLECKSKHILDKVPKI